MKQPSISENTKVTLSLLIAIIGGVFWLSKVYFLADSSASQISEIKQDQKRYMEDVAEMKADIHYIKQKMETD